VSGWVLVLVGSLLAAFGTAAGVGAAGLSRLELTRWVSLRLRGAGVAGALLGTPGRILGTANLIATGGTLLVALGLAGVFRMLPPPLLSATVILLIVPVYSALTYALPRALALRWPEPVVRAAVPAVDRLGRALTLLLPTSTVPGTTLTTMLRAGGGADLFERDELAVLSGLLAFTERPVREVMTARTELLAVAEGVPPEEVARIFAESGYSRVPVYRDSPDNIVGMIYVFDLLKLPPGGEPRVRPVLSVPASKRSADLLFEMQRERRQLAVVLDEFGGTAGITTLEDLLDDLVGEIFDVEAGEGARDPLDIELLEASGATQTAELAARFNVRMPSGSETIGGLLARVAGRIPRAGERLTYYGLEFDVLAATPTHVERAVVRRTPVPLTPLLPEERE
jgi:putative hemolysin